MRGDDRSFADILPQQMDRRLILISGTIFTNALPSTIVKLMPRTFAVPVRDSVKSSPASG